MHTVTKDETHQRDMAVDMSIHTILGRRNMNKVRARGCPCQQTTYYQACYHKYRDDAKIKSWESKHTPKKQSVLGCPSGCQSAVHNSSEIPLYWKPETDTKCRYLCTCIEVASDIKKGKYRTEREKPFRTYKRNIIHHAQCDSSLSNEHYIDTPTKFLRKASSVSLSSIKDVATTLTDLKQTSVPFAKHSKANIPLKSLQPTQVGSIGVGRHHSWSGTSSKYMPAEIFEENHFPNRKRIEHKKNQRETSSLDSYSSIKNADKILEEDGVKKFKCDDLSIDMPCEPSNFILADRHDPDRNTPTDIVVQIPLDNQHRVISKIDGKDQGRKTSVRLVRLNKSRGETVPSTPRGILSDIDILGSFSSDSNATVYAPDDVFICCSYEDTEISSRITPNVGSHEIISTNQDIINQVHNDNDNPQPLLKNESSMESTKDGLSIPVSKPVDSLNEVQPVELVNASISTQNILVNDHLYSVGTDSDSHSDTKSRIDSLKNLNEAVVLEKNVSSANRGRMKNTLTSLTICEDTSAPSKLSKTIVPLNSLDDAVGLCGDDQDDFLTADRSLRPFSPSFCTTTRVGSVGGGRNNSWPGTFSRKIPMEIKDGFPVPGEHLFTDYNRAERKKNQRQHKVHVSNPLIKINDDTSLPDNEDIDGACVTFRQQNVRVNTEDAYLRTGISPMRRNGNVPNCAETPGEIEVITISDDECPNNPETAIIDVARWLIDNKDKVTQDGFNPYGNGGQAMEELTAGLSSRDCLTPGLSNDLHSLNLTDYDLPCSVSEKPEDDVVEKIQPIIRRSISLPLDFLDELPSPGNHFQDADIESSDTDKETNGKRTRISSFHSSDTSVSGKDPLQGTSDESAIDEDNHPDTYHSIIDGLSEMFDDMDTDDDADILEDPDMTKATIDSITTDRITPLLKQELKLIINLRRSVYRSELPSLYTQFEKKKNHSYKISDQDNERWERKKVLSKESALRCRERQQNYEAELLQSYRKLKQSNSDLESEIKTLKEEMAKLTRVFDQHMGVCKGIGGEMCTTKLATQPLQKGGNV